MIIGAGLSLAGLLGAVFSVYGWALFAMGTIIIIGKLEKLRAEEDAAPWRAVYPSWKY